MVHSNGNLKFWVMGPSEFIHTDFVPPSAPMLMKVENGPRMQLSGSWHMLKKMKSAGLTTDLNTLRNAGSYCSGGQMNSIRQPSIRKSLSLNTPYHFKKSAVKTYIVLSKNPFLKDFCNKSFKVA